MGKFRSPCDSTDATSFCWIAKKLSITPELIVQSCLSCDNFDEKSETCKRHKARPPARVIAFGCDDYTNIDDEIPF